MGYSEDEAYSNLQKQLQQIRLRRTPDWQKQEKQLRLTCFFWFREFRELEEPFWGVVFEELGDEAEFDSLRGQKYTLRIKNEENFIHEKNFFL